MKFLNKINKWMDSYQHYRYTCGMNKYMAFYRAGYYEIKLKEPKKYRPNFL